MDLFSGILLRRATLSSKRLRVLHFDAPWRKARQTIFLFQMQLVS